VNGKVSNCALYTHPNFLSCSHSFDVHFTLRFFKNLFSSTAPLIATYPGGSDTASGFPRYTFSESKVQVYQPHLRSINSSNFAFLTPYVIYKVSKHFTPLCPGPVHFVVHRPVTSVSAFIVCLDSRHSFRVGLLPPTSP